MVSVTRRIATGAVVLLLLVAGFWASWDSAQHVLFPRGRERGTLTVTGCTDAVCAGPFAPASPTAVRHARVVIERSVGVKKGAEVPVVLRPSTREAVRAGAGGFFHAWIPFGGALLLGAPLIAAGVRHRRLAWISAGAGGLVLTAAFVAVGF
ncbi:MULTISPECIES: hypothetical protein [unclassified Streptomyces]|uniref:hypothetical protein n=1 Tax=unclassified Streptomyces TaxID=2593676 RepID=UPI00278C3904|nr:MULTISPECIES: hypothetical protein [unclassified Streptomyces]